MMKLNELKENTTLLIPASSMMELRQYLFDHQIKGIKLLSIQQFLDSFVLSDTSSFSLHFLALQRLKELQKELSFFQNICTDASFVKECLSFLETLHSYEITAEKLPQNNEKQKEMKKIMTYLYDLPTQGQLNQKILHSLTPLDISQLCILYPHASYKEQRIIEKLTALGAEQIELEAYQPHIEYQTAGNMRQEVESVAQKIIQLNLYPKDCMIAIRDESYLPLIRSVFARYHIPVALKDTQTSEVVLQCLALLKFSCNNNAENFMNCLVNHCFGNTFALLEAQKIWPYHWHENYPDLTQFKNELELYTPTQIQWLISLIEKANQQKEEIKPYLFRLTQAKNYLKKIEAADEILRVFHPNLQDQKIILRLQSLFQEASSFLHDPADFHLLLDELSHLQLHESSLQFNIIRTANVSDICLNYKHLFVLGAVQNAYPGFKGASGIFDENYIAEIEGYPSLEQRFETHNQSILSIFDQAENLHVTYPLNDYLGKAYESSLEVESYLHHDKPSAVSLVQVQNNTQEIENIDEDLAHQLYVKDQIFKGSVSSLESYVSCSYKYFLKNGCKIQEPFSVGFDVAKLGTLTHAVFEKLVNQYGKQYAAQKLDEAYAIMEQGFEEMHQIFPHLDFTVMRRKLKERLRMNLDFMKQMEEHSQLTPTHTEMEFHHLMPLSQQVTMDMRGYIDRIDEDNETFRIVDYKSSAHTLNKEKVFSGQQLQLCTYLTHMHDALHKRPLGAFYYSFHNEERKGPYEKIKRVGTYTITQTDINELNHQLFDSHLLSGWFFDEGYNRMDDIGAYTKSMGLNKDGMVTLKRAKVYDIEQVKEKIEEMLKIIASSILSGQVVPNPNKNSCTYCEYQAICRFHQAPIEKQLLVEYPECMQDKKKEEADNEQ